jgi:hypothetical protein
VRKLLFLPLVSLLWPALAWGGIAWCVPDGSVRSNCTHTAPTVQLAIDNAAAGSTIYIGPDVPPGRVMVTKRVSLLCLDGAVLTDAGLAPSATLPVVRLVGPITRPQITNCVIEARRSVGTLLIDPTAQFAVIQGTSLFGRSTPPPQYGLKAHDNPRLFFLGRGAGLQQPVVEGFVVGIDSKAGGWLDVEGASTGGVMIRHNGTGLRTEHDRGQVFYNFFEQNGVGMEVRGGFHMDLNSLRFFGNGVGMVWGLSDEPNPRSGCTSQKTMEHNHAIYADNLVNVLVETSPGVYTEDYTQDPGAGVQWTDMTFDGALQPYLSTGFRTSVCQP